MSDTTDIGLLLRESISAQISTLLLLTKSNKHTPEVLVHELRKGIKRIRSLFRLLKPVISESNFYKTNEMIAETGRILTVQRESYVNYITFQEIEKQFGDKLSISAKNYIRSFLEKQYKEAYTTSGNSFNNLTLKVSFQLSKIRDMINNIATRRFTSGLVQLAIERDFRKTSNYYNFSKISLNIEAIHRWRRFCKHIFTQLKFGPLSISDTNEQLLLKIDNIGEILGKEHDYAVLDLLFIMHCYMQIDQKDRIQLSQFIEKERNKLRIMAFNCGRELFAKQPVFNQPEIIPA